MSRQKKHYRRSKKGRLFRAGRRYGMLLVRTTPQIKKDIQELYPLMKQTEINRRADQIIKQQAAAVNLREAEKRLAQSVGMKLELAPKTSIRLPRVPMLITQRKPKVKMLKPSKMKTPKIKRAPLTDQEKMERDMQRRQEASIKKFRQSITGGRQIERTILPKTKKMKATRFPAPKDIAALAIMPRTLRQSQAVGGPLPIFVSKAEMMVVKEKGRKPRKVLINPWRGY